MPPFDMPALLRRRPAGHTMDTPAAPSTHRVDDASPVHYQCDCGQEGEIDPDPWRKGFTRRKLIQGGGYLAAAGLGSQLVTTSMAYAQTPDALEGNCVVVISLRGGADWLNICVPHGDDIYRQERPNIQVPTSALLAPDSMFGLNPAMQPLLELFTQGQLGIVHACGLPQPNYSHFDAMRVCEQGADSGLGSGWVNRLIEAKGLGATSFGTGIQFGGGKPYMLQGGMPTLSLRSLESFRLDGDQEARLALLNQLHSNVDDPTYKPIQDTLGGLAQAADISAEPYQPAVEYPGGGFAGALRNVAQTIKAQVGMQVACVDVGGWDTHTAMGDGSNPNSNFNQHVADFAAAVAAFCRDLGELLSKVTVVTQTEFGRRINENDGNGTDHGHGQAIMCIGAGVKGGYYADWPGLVKEQRQDDNLRATYDYRDVLSKVCVSAGVADPSARVFPGFKPRDLGVM